MTKIEYTQPHAMLHPVERLHHLAGAPEPDWQGKSKRPKATPPHRMGVCALTGQAGIVFDAKHVISDLFTAFDRLRFRDVDPHGLAFGTAAAWAVRNRQMLARPHVADSAGVREVDGPALYAALSSPLGDGVMVTVPVSRQKHTAPYVQPGTIRVDDRNLPWTAGDVDRLGTYRALRAAGFGETALTEPAPRWPILSKLDRESKRWVILRWSDLDLWRGHEQMDVAARATRTPKGDT